MSQINPLTEIVEVVRDTVIPQNHRGIVSRNGYLLLFVGSAVVFFASMRSLFVGPYAHDYSHSRFDRILMLGKHFINEMLLEKVEVVAENIVPEQHRGVFTVDGQFKKVRFLLDIHIYLWHRNRTSSWSPASTLPIPCSMRRSACGLSSSLPRDTWVIILASRFM